MSSIVICCDGTWNSADQEKKKVMVFGVSYALLDLSLPHPRPLSEGRREAGQSMEELVEQQL